MIITGYDREVEKCINELQKTYNCIILISDNGIVDIMYLSTGEHKTANVRMNNKCAMMTDIRRTIKAGR